MPWFFYEIVCCLMDVYQMNDTNGAPLNLFYRSVFAAKPP
jgi:hypothetical protein